MNTAQLSRNTADRGQRATLDGNNENSPGSTLTITPSVQAVGRSNQVQGEHLLGERHFIDWSVANAGLIGTSPIAPTSPIPEADPRHQLAPSIWPGAPRFATRRSPISMRTAGTSAATTGANRLAARR